MRRFLAALGLASICVMGANADPDTYAANPISESWIAEADILYIGDSESLGYFGDYLYRFMAGRKDPKSGKALKVWSYWTCGSDVMSWLSHARTVCGIRTCTTSGHCQRDHGPGGGPAKVAYGPIKTYLQGVKPRVTVISLGTNFLTAREFSGGIGFYLDRAATMVGEVKASGSRCVWIGPPQASLKTRSEAEYGGFIQRLKQRVETSGCRFIDSGPLSDRKFVLSRDPEGTHYQGEGEKKWATAVWQVLAPVLDKEL